ncbi:MULTISPECIES: sigma-70 family RNA polymerase sigma factor [Chromobacterium]|uniref:sigma-70 family RNA polymerase sigma factor n=1 Tax=Chromobacterium TaxID=535 RepID=UPI001886EABE|nr:MULTISPECIES: sigma-70 family RNA polymerase sigma factor [Chromobacterium]QOZ82001.1 RNA polymerase subunit sigma [Chromobacterium sp. Rain0013]WON82006.1 sigma-70 family RNA polymerase sigma factor [Chromobacterium haemolyticum]
MDNGPITFQSQLQSLYLDHHGWLCGLLQRKLGNPNDATDLAHDIYLHLIQKGRIPPADESRCHLAQIAKGKVIDLLRRRRLEASYLESQAQQPEPRAQSEEARALVKEEIKGVDLALMGKSFKVRQALLLSRLNGMSYGDIAAELQVSVSSVEKYVALGLQACRRSVEAGLGPDACKQQPLIRVVEELS